MLEQAAVKTANNVDVRHVAVVGDGKETTELAARLLIKGFAVHLAVSNAGAAQAARTGISSAIADLNADFEVDSDALTIVDRWQEIPAMDATFVWSGQGSEALEKALINLRKLNFTRGPTILFGTASFDARTVEPDAIILRHQGPLRRARFCELDLPENCDATALAVAARISRSLFSSVVMTRSSRKSALETLAASLLRASDFLVVEGASPYQVDAAFHQFGLREGPYRRLDDWGVNGPLGGGVLARALLERKRVGTSVGRGYYLHDTASGQSVTDETIDLMVTELRSRFQIEPREVTDAEIVERGMLALANAGAGLVSTGKLDRPSDIDAIAVMGLGFPRWLGGPMHWADESGLLKTQRRLQHLTLEDPDFWTPAPLFAALTKEGETFQSYSRMRGVTPA